jgi:hypothetical protein
MITKHSAEWAATRKFLETEEARIKEELAHPDCLVKQGEHLRGQIMYIRHFIHTIDPVPVEQVDTIAYT